MLRSRLRTLALVASLLFLLAACETSSSPPGGDPPPNGGPEDGNGGGDGPGDPGALVSKVGIVNISHPDGLLGTTLDYDFAVHAEFLGIEPVPAASLWPELVS